LKLLLDEMFSAEIAVQLRRRGSRGISQLVLALDALLSNARGLADRRQPDPLAALTDRRARVRRPPT